MGRTEPVALKFSEQEGRPWLCITQRSNASVEILDGAVSADGRIWGCYIHGLFENAPLRRAWLASLGWKNQTEETQSARQDAFDALADAIESALDMQRLYAILGMQ
jgi:adenosylcobyric acid synthase